MTANTCLAFKQHAFTTLKTRLHLFLYRKTMQSNISCPRHAKLRRRDGQAGQARRWSTSLSSRSLEISVPAGKKQGRRRESSTNVSVQYRIWVPAMDPFLSRLGQGPFRSWSASLTAPPVLTSFTDAPSIVRLLGRPRRESD